MLATALVLMTGAASLSSPPKAEAACSLVELCIETDAGGTAHLNVPPLSVVALVKPEVKPLEDCVWEVVEVDFGDGSPQAVYFWNAAKGLTGSHTFPHPGEYTVHIDATEGHHGEAKTEPPSPCPDLPIVARAVFPSPPGAPPPETPTPKPPGEGPGKKPPGESPGKTPGGGGGQHPTGSDGSSTERAEEEASGPSHPILHYKRCPKDVYAHRVACGKADKVIEGALEKLSKRRSALIAGFRCSLDPGAGRPIRCRRGKSRILGPPG